MKYCNPFHARTPRTIGRPRLILAEPDPARLMALGKAAALSRALDSIGKRALTAYDAQEATIAGIPRYRPITLEEARQNAQEWASLTRDPRPVRLVCNNGGIAALIHGDRPWKP